MSRPESSHTIKVRRCKTEVLFPTGMHVVGTQTILSGTPLHIWLRDIDALRHGQGLGALFASALASSDVDKKRDILAMNATNAVSPRKTLKAVWKRQRGRTTTEKTSSYTGRHWNAKTEMSILFRSCQIVNVEADLSKKEFVLVHSRRFPTGNLQCDNDKSPKRTTPFVEPHRGSHRIIFREQQHCGRSDYSDETATKRRNRDDLTDKRQ